MQNCFIAVTIHDGTPSVEITLDHRTCYFPLTKKGCIEAGKRLCEEKITSWMCSSSVDFPREYKKSFNRKYNVSDLIDQGYTSAMAPPAIEEKRVGDYEIRGNQFVAIAINVNNASDSYVFDIDPFDIDPKDRNAFIKACIWIASNCKLSVS